MPKPCNHLTEKPNCPACNLAITSPDHQKLWNIDVSPDALSIYIPELDRELSGRMLEIYTGRYKDGSPLEDMPEHIRLQFVANWKRQKLKKINQPVKKCNCKNKPN